MNFLENFLRALFSDYSLEKSNENDVSFSVKYNATKYDSSSFDDNMNYLSFLQERDSIHISISLGNADPIIFNSKNDSLSTFKESLDEEANYLDDNDTVSVLITINKKIENSKCTIYNFKSFIDDLKSLNASEFFTIFSRLLNETGKIQFEILDFDTIFYTNTIYFTSINRDVIFELDETRNKKFDGFKSFCHFSNPEKLQLLPSDFSLIKKDEGQDDVNDLFNHYSILLSLIYLFDISYLKDNHFEFKVNGYKVIQGKQDLPLTDFNDLENYLEIFNWVYNGGNLLDKIGLARNIISLHFVESGKLLLNGDPLQSIKSSHKIYERQNIKQYIEIRNKISDQLLDFNNRANKIVESFASGFQKSILAVLSYYISTIILKVIGKNSGEFLNIFTFDATILSLTFLCGAFIYYFVLRWEIQKQKERFISSYQNLKKRYTDLLEESDINRILNNDIEFSNDVNFIEDKAKIYSRMWIAILLLLGMATIILFFSYNLPQLYETHVFKITKDMFSWLFEKICPHQIHSFFTV